METLHDRALKWVAEKVNGKVTHSFPPSSKDFLGRHYPDVVVGGDPYACI
jgi:hypothetical protein